ncbi:MAG: amidohydrolase family protein [Acidobacteria bacterium]|nr:amidohydrolase family protein [Acidobacteriota bacterium]
MRKTKKPPFITVFLGLIFLLTGRWTGAAGLDADLVIYNGKILTVDSPDPSNFTTAQAAVVYDGKFVAVGTNEEALQYAGPDTRKIDLGGRTVIPGLIDTHFHSFSYASHYFPLGAPRDGQTDPPILWTNKAEFLAQIRTLALKKKTGEWIITSLAGGEGVSIVPELQRGEVTLADLDQVAPNNPVMIHWVVRSEGLVNSKALNPVLDRYPKIGGVARDAQGRPTGRVSGMAAWGMALEFWPKTPPEQLGPYYKMELEEALAQGMTTFSSRATPNQLRAYAWLHARGELPMRFGYGLEAANRNPNVDATLSRLVGLQGGAGQTMWGSGDDKLWMVGMALSNIDHITSIAGACVDVPYPREVPEFPMWRYQFWGPHGLCTLESPDYNDVEVIRSAAKYGFRISGTHTAGARTLGQYLDILEEVVKDYPHIAEQRWAVDHVLDVGPGQAERARKFNLYFSVMPPTIYDPPRDMEILYGEEGAGDRRVPTRTLLDNGLRVVMELDRHNFHPLLGLQVVVNRKDINGKQWGPQQRVSRSEALYMNTRWASEYVLRENLLGSIEPKKYADFVVLNRDYLTVPEDEIGRIDPLLTVVGGQIAYSDPDFATSQGLPQVGYRGDRSEWLRGAPEEATRGSTM